MYCILRIAFRNFITACRAHAAFFYLSFICLISVLVSILYIQQHAYSVYKDAVSTWKETKTLYFSCKDPAAVHHIAAELSDSPSLPKAAVISVSGGQYCGLYWDRSQKEDVWHTPYGRFFTMDEMEAGAKVAILSTGYIGQLPFEEMDSLWESGIEVGGVPYKVVGNYYLETADVPEEVYRTEPLCAPIVIPLKTFWDGGFFASRFRCEFTAPVTAEQRALLTNLLQRYDEIHSLSLPETSNRHTFVSYVGGMASSTLIVLMALVSCMNILLYWLRREFERYRIYRICGAGRGQIVFLLLFQILFLITLAYLCAYGIARMLVSLMPAGIVLPLPGILYAGIYLALLLFIGAVALIKAYPRVLRGRILDQ